MNLLSIHNLSVHYIGSQGTTKAVDDVSLNLKEGELLGIVGESGCGKTTLARSITGVIAPSAKIISGEIFFQNTDILNPTNSTTAHNVKWKKISFIPQSAMNSLDPVYKIRNQMREILMIRGGFNKKQADEKSNYLFDLVGIDVKRLRDYPHQFSGGMKQRVAIAMAIALDPKIIIADEPVTALDVIVQRQILDLFDKLKKSLNLSIILVTHDISVIAYSCQKVAVMYAGEIIEMGSVKSVLEKPLHPYTMGLNNAFPDLLSKKGDYLVPIEGSPPNLLNPPIGCRFKMRCPFSQDQCNNKPEKINNSDRHVASCWRESESDQLRIRANEPSTWINNG